MDSSSCSKKIGTLLVEVLEADISRLPVDAVVNAANNHFWMGGGVAGALKRAGGDAIEKEAMAQGPKPPGQAVTTGGGRLPAKHVIHAAVMGQDLRTGADLIREAAANSLKEAERLGASSLAFPALGTGVGGFPLEDCARIMLEEVRRFAPAARSVNRVVFALFGAAAREAFGEVLKNMDKEQR